MTTTVDSNKKLEAKKRSLANLQPARPGEVRNPRGRPRKEESLTSLLKAEVEKMCPTDKEGRTWKELLVNALLRLALKGNMQAMKEVFDRTDGKVPQGLSGAPKEPITIVMINE